MLAGGMVGVSLATGCNYEAPLTVEHEIPIDPAVLGHWQQVPDGDQAGNGERKMLVLKYSDTEYMIHYPTGEKGLFFRAYPIEISGARGIQIQWIGTGARPLRDNETKRYQMVRYGLANGEMEIELLNQSVVSSELIDSEALRQAFLKNREEDDLFGGHSRFRKLSTPVTK
jgi:hypothetical protein